MCFRHILPDMATAPAGDEPPEAPEPTPQLAAWLETHGDGPDTYTVAPSEAAGVELMSRWITVPVTAVLDLEEMR